MGKAGRVACIFTPFVLTLAALACLVVIFLAGTMAGNQTLGDLYFLKINMTDIQFSDGANILGDLSSTDVTTLEGALQAAKQQLNLKDYYTIYLRSYCSWNNGAEDYAICSSPQNPFAFDPLEAWGINAAAASRGINTTTVLPDGLRKGLDIYTKLSHAMYYLYVIAVATTAATAVVGLTAIFSRWGSFFTTFFASVAAFVVVVGSGLATAMFPTLKGAIEGAFDNTSGNVSSLGVRVLALTWIAAAFAIASWLFWTLSICCCSGRSPYHPGSKDARRTRAEKTPYTYERVGSPYMAGAQQQGMPMNTMNRFTLPGHGSQPMPAGGPADRATAFEPYRSQV